MLNINFLTRSKARHKGHAKKFIPSPTFHKLTQA